MEGSPESRCCREERAQSPAAAGGVCRAPTSGKMVPRAPAPVPQGGAAQAVRGQELVFNLLKYPAHVRVILSVTIEVKLGKIEF